MAQTAGPAQSQAASSAPGSSYDQNIETVVVTAEKRSSTVLNVPASVQAITGDRLQDLNVTSLADLTGYVPSLTLSSYGAPGANTLEVRGLGDGYLSDFSGPLVSTYIDDLGVGSSTSAGRGNLFGLDLMPYDIDHVEVLEGPQGTLYGSDAMGGLIKYTLKQPNLTRYSGAVGGDVAHEDNSGSVDGAVRGFVNIPLINGELGLRVSAFDKSTAGYIDNIGISRKDSNSSNEGGGRAALLWVPDDRFSLKASVLLQFVHQDDISNIVLNGSSGQPLYGPNTTSSAFAQPMTQRTQDYSVDADYDFGFATLSTVVGYSNLNTGLNEDFTPQYGPYVLYGPVPVKNALGLWLLRDQVSKVTEETRLTSTDTGRFSWIAGQFYTRENASERFSLPTFTSAYVPLPAGDNIFLGTSGSNFQEVAVFGDLTYKLTDSFDLTGGGRWTHFSQLYTSETHNSVFARGGSPLEQASGNVWTWMGNARYHIDENQMVYVRVANGFRPGAVNLPLPGVPGAAQPDTTVDYEIGYKSSLLRNRLQLTATAFHIDWNNIQESVFTTTVPKVEYIGNSSGAASDGFELATSFRITPELKLGVNTAFTNARLTSAAPVVGGLKGDQLPLSARFVGSVTVDYAHDLDGQSTFLAGASYRHKDHILDQFTDTPGGSMPLGAQDIAGAYVGLTSGPYSLRLYANNISNNRSYGGLLYLQNYGQPHAVPVQPQTVGLSFDYRFE